MRLVHKKHEDVKPGLTGRVILTGTTFFPPYKHFDWHTRVNSDPAEHAQALLLFNLSCKKAAKLVKSQFSTSKKWSWTPELEGQSLTA